MGSGPTGAFSALRTAATQSPMAILLLSFLFSFALAQEGAIIDPSKLPACAPSCALLNQAQQLCTPPIAPAQGQAIYQACFCNSNYLVNYRAGATAGICDAECTSDADRQAIMQWYNGLCQGGVVVVPAGSGGGSDEGRDIEQVSTDAPATNPRGGTTTSTSSGANAQASSGPHRSWISTHYQWIIMVVILLLAGIGAIFLGLWFKRRHDRKWATGGFAHDSMLNTRDIATSLSNRHPMASVSQVHVPRSQAYLNGSREVLTEGGVGAARGSWRGKERTEPEIQEVNPERPASVAGKLQKSNSVKRNSGQQR